MTKIINICLKRKISHSIFSFEFEIIESRCEEVDDCQVAMAPIHSCSTDAIAYNINLFQVFVAKISIARKRKLQTFTIHHYPEKYIHIPSNTFTITLSNWHSSLPINIIKEGIGDVMFC